MFKSCKHIHSIFDAAKQRYTDEFIFLLEDTHFKYAFIVNRGIGLFPPVFSEYRRRKLPISKNLALFYIWLRDASAIPISKDKLETDRKRLDQQYPEFQYGQKYYRCILNRLKEGGHILEVKVLVSVSKCRCDYITKKNLNTQLLLTCKVPHSPFESGLLEFNHQRKNSVRGTEHM